jgi:DNA-binding winged helix-turn-helix (wHTH) protein
VFFRRHFSEFRDNFVDKSTVIRRGYDFVGKFVRTAKSSSKAYEH